MRHERGVTVAMLSERDLLRLKEAYRKNHETLRRRWGTYLASKDRLLELEIRVKPVAIVTLSRFLDLLEGLVDMPTALPEWQQGIVVADQQPGLRVLRPGWTVVHGAKPFSFARNANIGIAAAGNADVLLVNDDVTGLTPEGVQELQRIAYRYPDVGILAASIKGEVGNYLQYWDCSHEERIVSEERLCFVCVYLRRQVIRHLGLMDEASVLEDGTPGYGGDDCEYCLRAQEAGYKLAVTRRVVVAHAGSVSFRRVMPEEERIRQTRCTDAIVRAKYGTCGHP
jgi:hypothetical protein